MKEVMELIKFAGLMKTVSALPQCFEGLVEEFVVNIPEDISDKNNKEFCKVFVRRRCVRFSSTIMNKFLGRGTEGAVELETTDNEVYRTITAGQVKEWPRKKHDTAERVIDLEEESSEEEDDTLVHHLKPSVAKKMKTRKVKTEVEMLTARTSRKAAVVGPSKSWSKVEVQKRKVRESSDSEDDVEDDVPDISPAKTQTVRKSPAKVTTVHLDNISFHLEDSEAKESDAHTSSDRSNSQDQSSGSFESESEEDATSSD